MQQLSANTEAIPVSEGSVKHFSCHQPNPNADQAVFHANMMKVVYLDEEAAWKLQI